MTSFVLDWLGSGSGGSGTIILSENTTGIYTATHNGVEDAGMQVGSATTNFGSSVTAAVGGNDEPYLIKPNGLAAALTAVGATTITAVRLRLHRSANAGTDNILIRKVLLSWTEAGVTYNTRNGTDAWNSGGAGGGGTDIETTNDITVAIASGTGIWVTVDSATHAYLLTMVQAWQGSPSTNHGVRLKGDGATYPVFITSEGTDGLRPVWEIDWSS